MIYIQTLDKRWEPGKKLTKGYPKHIRLEFQRYIAKLMVKYIKSSIDSQRYGSRWSPLSSRYLEYKKSKGFSLKTWEATGQLKKELKVMTSGSTLVIGFDKRKRHKESREKLYKIARKLEYGSLRIPPRPLFRFCYLYFSKNINRFWLKFKEDRGI